ncbi:hypothetical protein GIB67_028105 [Kingdonia uniflora]|uniref:Cytochrome P450 n=1 Tax=Kingdonia uniflora TaxID=39325 RepID=A0A7J7NRG9_9MAGN|nr:hypothetical protein GIB67_028105 [Kingdonia uniflora]
MLQLEFIPPFLLFLVPLIFLVFISSFNYVNTKLSSSSKLPRSYPLIGSYFAITANQDRHNQLFTEILRKSSTLTFVLHRLLGFSQVITANPANVEHILKTKFSIYPKGQSSNDFLGSGIFNTDGSNWKFQRQIESHEFNTKSLRKFVETVVESEISDRLLPILSDAAAKKSVMDLQDILQRFAFDNICKISFGFDPEYLSASMHPTEFAVAFEDATLISSKRFTYLTPAIWKVEQELLKEINEKADSSVYNEVKDMVYTHASLCESMRLYPPVPADTKEAARD